VTWWVFRHLQDEHICKGLKKSDVFLCSFLNQNGVNPSEPGQYQGGQRQRGSEEFIYLLISLQICDGELQRDNLCLLVAGVQAESHGHRLLLRRSRLVIRKSFLSRKAAPHWTRSPREAGDILWGGFKTCLDNSMVDLL